MGKIARDMRALLEASKEAEARKKGMKALGRDQLRSLYANSLSGVMYGEQPLARHWLSSFMRKRVKKDFQRRLTYYLP